ncbi:hypothetical protein HYT51_01995 [Candidatus Woesearchaeota archaeon]|nr:hypothetical protein [Candidatus Woesearchaeota archaeon]
MSLSSKDLLKLITHERGEVIFERTDPCDDYSMKEERKKLPLLEVGHVYRVQRIDLYVYGTIPSDEYQTSLGSLVKKNYLLPYPETSKIIINGYAYSSFCFSLTKP